MKKVLASLLICSVLLVGCGDSENTKRFESLKYLGSQEMVVSDTIKTVFVFQGEDDDTHLFHTSKPENWVMEKGDKYNVTISTGDSWAGSAENTIVTVEYVK